MKRVPWGGLLTAALLLHLAGIPFSARLVTTSPDFASYYVAGWAARNGVPLDPWADTVHRALESGVAAAGFATPYRYPPYFAYAIVPLTCLPYAVARTTWLLLLLAGAVAGGAGLARRTGFPILAGAALGALYAPAALGIGWGNVAVLLPLALLLLARGIARSQLWLAPFAFIASTKIFPFLWLWIPLRLRRHKVWMAAGATALLLLLVPSLADRRAGLVSAGPAMRQGAWILDPADPRLGQPNLWSLAVQLTQPFRISYAQHGLQADAFVPPLCPLDPAATVAIGVTLSALAVMTAGFISARMLRRTSPERALWFLAAALCVALPVTNYPYLAVTLPGLFVTIRSCDPSVRWMSAAAFAGIGLGRFTGYITAAVPSAWPIGHAGTASALMLCAALLRQGPGVGATSVAASLTPPPSRSRSQ